MTPEERKEKVRELRREHQKFFSSHERLDKDGLDDALYIPKMAYRPSGKDELHISFFPSELQKGKDVYTEFVSIDYESEDPKRTLYLWEYNAHWEEEYELIESSSGFQRHIIPVGELKVINDINSRNPEVEKILDISEPSTDTNDIVSALNRIADNLETLNKTIYNKQI